MATFDGSDAAAVDEVKVQEGQPEPGEAKIQVGQQEPGDVEGQQERQETVKPVEIKSYLEGPVSNLKHMINWVDCTINSNNLKTGTLYVLDKGILWRKGGNWGDTWIEKYIPYDNIAVIRSATPEEVEVLYPNCTPPKRFMCLWSNAPLIEIVLPGMFKKKLENLDESILQLKLEEEAVVGTTIEGFVEVLFFPNEPVIVERMVWNCNNYMKEYLLMKDIPTEFDFCPPGQFLDVGESLSKEEEKKAQAKYEATIKKYGNVKFQSSFGLRFNEPRVYNDFRKPIEPDGVLRMTNFWRHEWQPDHWLFPRSIENVNDCVPGQFADCLNDRSLEPRVTRRIPRMVGEAERTNVEASSESGKQTRNVAPENPDES